MKDSFLELSHHQVSKRGQSAPGDAFQSIKCDDGRVIAVLSDGLGSGIKAGVLATLTATMAARCVAADIPLRRVAEFVMRSLPVCSERKISYATFTIVDVAPGGSVRVVEYDNPPYLLLRSGRALSPEKAELRLPRGRGGAKGDAVLKLSSFDAQPGDRVVLYSDGVTQAGMGTRSYPLGWGDEAVKGYAAAAVAQAPDGVSARELARTIVHEAVAKDAWAPKDDITCGVAYWRHPRRLLVLTGPPVSKDRDREMNRIYAAFDGRKAIAGGTTANIIARETGRAIKVDLSDLDPEIPPQSTMPGADLVTEGILTLARVAALLESGQEEAPGRRNAATRLLELMLDSDVIQFVVGTRINEAHQDPTMPLELEIRRNVVKRIAAILESRHLKDTRVSFI
ncbi:MAG TPA: PP2C family protein-serine/threonine phosphatase [Spirochaetia bacterium]|nr:PP2C family protein-serine/threonine phosphatase [Spirochaetales bacterium]HRW23162.1 PP2C family protein-serine/threonine phosphatase [Spirochaetia bacterium]